MFIHNRSPIYSNLCCRPLNKVFTFLQLFDLLHLNLSWRQKIFKVRLQYCDSMVKTKWNTSKYLGQDMESCGHNVTICDVTIRRFTRKCLFCWMVIWLCGAVLWTVGMRQAESPSGSPGHGGGLGSSLIKMRPWLFRMICQWIMESKNQMLKFKFAFFFFLNYCEFVSGNSLSLGNIMCACGCSTIVFLRRPGVTLLFEWRH